MSTNLVLTWDQKDPKKLLFFYKTITFKHTSILDLKVFENCWINIELDPKKDWRWSLDLDAVTTKDPRDQLYFELGYQTADGLFTRREEVPADEPVRVMRFGAALGSGPDNEPHGFSFNIDLIYADGILPITLDPDIRNPGSSD